LSRSRKSNHSLNLFLRATGKEGNSVVVAAKAGEAKGELAKAGAEGPEVLAKDNPESSDLCKNVRLGFPVGRFFIKNLFQMVL
jgi:hypothetical protein